MGFLLQSSLLCLICIFAAAVHGAVGIGFPMIATPLLALVTDVRTAILILVLPTVTLNLINIVQGGRWGKSIAQYWPLALYGTLGSYMGTKLLVVVPPENFRPLLAAALVFYLNAERLGVGFSWVRSRPHFGMALFGTGAGVLGGTVNVMLPVLVIFALEMKMEKTVTIQVFNFCFLFGKLTQGFVFYKAGLFSSEILQLSLLLVVFSVIISLLAMTLRRRIDEAHYKRWMRYLLLVLSVVLVVQFFFS